MSLRESDFDCPRCSDAAAYVLGALEDDELHLYRAHLDTCAQCRAEVAELQPVADELPAGVAPAVASGQLRERILASVRAEAELLDAAGERADRPPRASAAGPRVACCSGSAQRLQRARRQRSRSRSA